MIAVGVLGSLGKLSHLSCETSQMCQPHQMGAAPPESGGDPEKILQSSSHNHYRHHGHPHVLSIGVYGAVGLATGNSHSWRVVGTNARCRAGHIQNDRNGIETK